MFYHWLFQVSYYLFVWQSWYGVCDYPLPYTEVPLPIPDRRFYPKEVTSRSLYTDLYLFIHTTFWEAEYTWLTHKMCPSCTNKQTNMKALFYTKIWWKIDFNHRIKAAKSDLELFSLFVTIYHRLDNTHLRILQCDHQWSNYRWVSSIGQ